jgi:hypothetical protein
LGKPSLSQPATILECVVADEVETDFVVSLRLGVELGEAPVGAVFAKKPIERAERCHYRSAVPTNDVHLPAEIFGVLKESALAHLRAVRM